jgi:serine/threonine protein kinase
VIQREQFGDYTLLRQIAVGGMGELYLAERPTSHGYPPHVVVKRIRSDLIHDDDFVEMFLNEGQLASRLHHPNIVQIHDLGQVDGVYFMSMEYVAGQNLADLIDRLDGPLDLACSLHVMSQLCQALASAHEARDEQGRDMKLVHRDISPPNVLISYAGAVKLTDFGIAKVAQQRRQTQAGVLKGKFAYLSPEQAMGEPIDRRSDIYALGLVLFEATIGKRGNPGAVEVEQISAACRGLVSQPSLEDPSYPPELERIYLKATATAPRDRYQTAREMHRDLEEFRARAGLVINSAQLGDFLRRAFPKEAQEAIDELRNVGGIEAIDSALSSDSLEGLGTLSSIDSTEGETDPMGPRNTKKSGFGAGFDDEETVLHYSEPAAYPDIAEATLLDAQIPKVDVHSETIPRAHSAQHSHPHAANPDPFGIDAKTELAELAEPGIYDFEEDVATNVNVSPPPSHALVFADEDGYETSPHQPIFSADDGPAVSIDNVRIPAPGKSVHTGPKPVHTGPDPVAERLVVAQRTHPSGPMQPPTRMPPPVGPPRLSLELSDLHGSVGGARPLDPSHFSQSTVRESSSEETSESDLDSPPKKKRSWLWILLLIVLALGMISAAVYIGFMVGGDGHEASPPPSSESK